MFSKLVYTSDMHFDEESQLLPKFEKECVRNSLDWLNTCKMRETFFIQDYLKLHKGSVLVIAGDVYRDVNQTIEFANRLEKLKITGFFILGNHEFIGEHTFTRANMASYSYGMTCDNKYFKFLHTGIKHKIGDYCIIGDAAWPPSTDTLLYKKWIDFAESVAATEKRIIVVSHFPMRDITRYSTSFQLFGHLHTASTKNGNHFSNPYLENQDFGVINLGGI